MNYYCAHVTSVCDECGFRVDLCHVNLTGLIPLETLEAIGIELAQLIASKERHDMTSIRLLVHLRELRDRIKRVVDNTRGTRAPEQKEEKAHGIKS